MLLAYTVTTNLSEVSVIVYAESVSQAKSEALKSEWMSYEERVDIRVKRQPRLDMHAELFGKGALDLATEDQVHLARSLGWHEIMTGGDPCASCGLFEWAILPESKLREEDGICGYCVLRLAKVLETLTQV